MLYMRSQEIELRLTEVLRLIRTGRFSTPGLAEKIGVSIPTISRCVVLNNPSGPSLLSSPRSTSRVFSANRIQYSLSFCKLFKFSIRHNFIAPAGAI